MSNLLQCGLVTTVTTSTMLGVCALGKAAYVINNNTKCCDPKQLLYGYGYRAENTVSDKIMFIPKQFTEGAIYSNYLSEQFESTKQLFYYLRHRSNLAAIHGDLRVFQFYDQRKPREILVFCTDLHRKNGAEPLYIVGHRNTKSRSNQKGIEKWKMSEFFMTANEIYDKYGIKASDLPPGASSHLQRFNVQMHINHILGIKNTVSAEQYAALKCIKTKHSNNLYKTSTKHKMSQAKWVAAIRSAAVLKPIISFSEDKCTYYIDMVLLVNIGCDNWIGIIFRNYNDHNYTPIDLAIDCYDIRNKMMLFAPPRNKREYDEIYKYKNNISGLCIVDHDISNKYSTEHHEQQRNFKRMEELEQRLFEANQRIIKQDKMIETLKQQNNHYFQQCFDPKSSIIPHPIHQTAAKEPPVTLSPYVCTVINKMNNM